jgi:hypothetical protein
VAKIGTPENPEILDPTNPGEDFNEGSQQRRAPRSAIGWRARLKLIRQMAMALLGATIPALLIDSISLSLVQSAWAGSTLAGLGAILLFVPSLILTVIAIGAFVIFAPLILITLFGRRLTAMNRFGAFDPRTGAFNATGFGGPFGFRDGRAGPFNVRVFRFGSFNGGNTGRDFGRFEENEPRDVTQSSPRLRGDDGN